MIAAQYSFALPADYDMDIIERRIRDKGPMLDGFPMLAFKAYLSARKADGSAENLYAPFYLWRHPDGLSDFLAGAGFAGLARDFGWPVVRTWIVWQAEVDRAIAEARFASRDLESIRPYADLAGLWAEAANGIRADVEQGALAAVAGFDPTGWTLVRFRLWRERPAPTGATGQIYAVGHVSLP